MSFTRARTQVLTRLMPGALFIHDDYGVCQVASVDLDPTEAVNVAALLDAVRDYLAQWDGPLRAGYVLDATIDPRRLFVVGAPTRVRFIPYPDLLQCSGCGRVAPLRRLRAASPGICPACGTSMRQVRFVESHACGRLEPLSTPTCPVHGDADVALETTGRYRSLAWRCLACGGAFLTSVRNRSCMCEVTRRNAQDHFFSRLMRGSVVTDSALHLVHTVPFLNLPGDEVDAILRAPDGRLLALARSCGVLSTPVLVALASTTGLDPSPVVAELLTVLRAQGVDPDVLAVAVGQVHGHQTAVTKALQALETAYGLSGDVLRGRVPRRVVEFAALLDSGAVRSLTGLRTDLKAAGDVEGMAALNTGAVQAQAMGLSLSTLDAFPLALTAVGFSRQSRAPNMCAVVPFALPGEGRVPLYVLANTTEAVCLQLDPARVLDWLAHQGLVDAGEDDALATWAALHTQVPGLLQTRYQLDYDAPAAVAVRMLLHTVSHTLLQAISVSGYAPESVGEFLFPETLAVVLYANRFTDTKIGGLLTLVERSLAAWLTQARDMGRTCLHDPLCTDAGGACAACLHREHGCAHGNRELSRAVLFGGVTTLGNQPFEVTRGFWEA